VSPKENPPRDEGARDKGAKQEAEAADAKAAEVKETPGDEVPPEQEAVEADAPEAGEAPDEQPDAQPDAEADGQADDQPDAEADDDAPADDASDEDEADDQPDAEADDDAAAEEKPKRGRRRGSAETVAATEPKRPAPRRPDGAVVIKAQARYVRSAPRKARLVMDHIRGQPVEQARAMLEHTPRAASADILKLLDSALANAESNYELAADELRVERAFVDEGPIIKRYRPRALGRATRINKRTSHMTIELTTTSEGA
jgi:ribosomal protein L22